LKKLIAITLLVSHLFSTGGYVAFYKYLQYRTDVFFNQQAAQSKYNKNDLVEVKILIDMPNMADWTAYENVSGTVQFADASYNYVKMKMTRHAVYLMCIPNYESTIYSTSNVIVAKDIKDIPVPKKNHVPFLKLNLNEKAQFFFQQFAFSTPIIFIKTNSSQPPADLLSAPLRIPDQPPKISC
jgi:hypothetical protein